jgi:uncharacterized membrane protein
MAKIDKSIIIHAPVEKVFKFMADPYNLQEIWPAMVEIRDVTENPLGGMNFGWTYKMAGMKFDGASVITEFIPNKRSVTHSTKGIESTFCWEYEEVAEGTHLHLEVEYKVPIPLIGKIAEAIILKQNEHEAHTTLHNLKDRMEIQVPIVA